MERFSLLAVVAVAFIALGAVVPAAAMSGPGQGPGMGGEMGFEAEVSVESYTQEAVIGPTTASGYVEVEITPAIPVTAFLEGYLSPGAAGLLGSLSVLFNQTNVTGILSYSEEGYVSYDAEAFRGESGSAWKFLLDVSGAFYNETTGSVDYYAVKLDFSGSDSSTYTNGTTASTLKVSGEIVYNQTGTDNVYVRLLVNALVDTYLSLPEDNLTLSGSVSLDFETGNPLVDVDYAMALYGFLDNYVKSLGLDEYVEVSVDTTNAIVYIEFHYTGNLTPTLPPAIPGVPGGLPSGLPAGPGVGGFPGFPAMARMVGFNVSFDIDYSVNVTASLDETGLRGSVSAEAAGIPGELFDGASYQARLAVAPDPERNVTIVRVEVNATGLSDPAAAYYTAAQLALAAADALEDSDHGETDYRVTFRGVDGVMFGFEGPEYEVVTFTLENASEISDLKLYYNGTEYGFSEGCVSVKAREGGEARVTIPPGVNTVKIQNAVKATLKLGPAAGVFNVSNTTLVLETPMGAFKLHLKEALALGQVNVEALDPGAAESLIPPGLQATAAGPALKIEGIVKGGGCVEIPLVKEPQSPALIRVKADGTYEVITNVTVEDGVLKACVPGFSTLIPVDLQGEAPPGGGEATTTTTTTGEATTTTTTKETTTQPPATTTTTEERTTTTTTTTTQKETTTTTTTTTTTQPPQGTPAATTTSEEGGRGTLIAAVVVVIILAGAAAFLLRR